MSPVFNDKFDALMHPKRQEPTTGSNTNSNSPTSAPPTEATTTPPLPPTTTQSSTTTSSTSNTSQPPTSTSSVVTTSTSSSASSTIPTTTSAPTSTTISTTSATPTSTTAAVSTTAPTTAPASTAAPSTISRTGSTVTPTLIRSTSDGRLVTVTAVVGATESASAAGSTKTPFFKNTGAVVGVFVVVGIVATALLVVFGTMFIRRRRAKQFDREVQEAAREAVHTQPPIDDDDDYAGGTSYNTHASQPMSTERPGAYGGYGATGASSWDPYGRAAAPGTGYEMQHRRTSTGTGVGPGVAGFATGDVFARNAAPEPQGYNQGYGQGYAQDSYNTGYGQAYAGNQQYNNQAYNPAPQQSYPLAQPQNQAGRAPVQAQMMMPEAQRHSYNNVGAFRQSPSYGEAHPGEHVEYGHAEQQHEEDPYGGYEPYEAGPSQTQSQGHGSNPPAYAVGASGTAGALGDRKGGHVARQPSAGERSGATRYSDDEDDIEPPRRVLKVANQ